MRTIRSTFTFVVLGLLCLGTSLWAERLPAPVQRPNPPSGILPLTQNSGYEFAGTVKAVQHVSPVGRGVGITRITFHVDTAVRGVRSGQTLVIAEWAALWTSGERYRVGERVFLFLYPPSKLGLTSPVRGTAGKFRIGGNGRIEVRPEQKAVLPERVANAVGGQHEIEIREFAGALRMADRE
jgi:hypothetical protein